jgi:tetratricopeptide (TPR) repeat protein
MDLASLAIKQALAGHFKDAQETNLKILKQDPNDIDALNRLAQTHLQLNQVTKAKKAYQKVLDLDRFNPIAKRNLEKMKDRTNGNSKAIPLLFRSSRVFVEEPGKTKLVGLVQLGEVGILADLSTGQVLAFTTRGRDVCCFTPHKEYVGRLPDDLSRRLIWLMDRGNQYKAYVKCVEKNRVLVFLRETRQAKANDNFPSFPSSDKGNAYLILS